MLPDKMYVSYSTELLVKLCEIWPNPKTGQPGLNPSELAVEAGFKTRQAVYNFFEGRRPNEESRLLLGKYFGVYFTDDWDGHTPSIEVIIATKKAFLDKYVYKKASA